MTIAQNLYDLRNSNCFILIFNYLTGNATPLCQTPKDCKIQAKTRSPTIIKAIVFTWGGKPSISISRCTTYTTTQTTNKVIKNEIIFVYPFLYTFNDKNL